MLLQEKIGIYSKILTEHMNTLGGGAYNLPARKNPLLRMREISMSKLCREFRVVTGHSDPSQSSTLP
jgi:hypothetical protein